jgi:hypothetical protein
MSRSKAGDRAAMDARTIGISRRTVFYAKKACRSAFLKLADRRPSGAGAGAGIGEGRAATTFAACSRHALRSSLIASSISRNSRTPSLMH